MRLIAVILYLSSLEITAQITVAEGSFKVAGLTEENLYFGFAEGDQVEFSLKEVRGKDIREIEIIEYPSSSRFSAFKTIKVNQAINIPKTGIYQFRIYNGAIGGRFCEYSITRTPASPDTENFNTAVYWETHHDTTWVDETESYFSRDEYVPKVIVPSSDFYINSGSNADFKGGKSRISIPVSIPENTVKWYYSFSASRNPEDVAALQNTFNLIGQFSQLVDQTGTLQFGMNMLTQPPGADFCDVYLLDHDNNSLFLQKQPYRYLTAGTRENIKSGISEMEFGAGNQYYLGIKNPDYQNGVHVIMEVVAIVHEQEYAERTITAPKVNTYKTPYLKN